jgi:hypothetical protein
MFIQIQGALCNGTLMNSTEMRNNHKFTIAPLPRHLPRVPVQSAEAGEVQSGERTWGRRRRTPART